MQDAEPSGIGYGDPAGALYPAPERRGTAVQMSLRGV